LVGKKNAFLLAVLGYVIIENEEITTVLEWKTLGLQ
jgi:hypothetical protein